MSQSLRFLTNRGLSYPFSIDGLTSKSEGITYIRQAVRAYLETQFFELLFKPSGSRIRELIYEPIDELFFDTLLLFVSDALKEFTLINFRSVSIEGYSFGNPQQIVQLRVAYSINKPFLSDEFLYDFTTNPTAGSNP